MLVVLHFVAVLHVDLLTFLHVHLRGLRVRRVPARLVEVASLLSLGLLTLRVQPSDDLIVHFIIRLYVVILNGTYA